MHVLTIEVGARARHFPAILERGNLGGPHSQTMTIGAASAAVLRVAQVAQHDNAILTNAQVAGVLSW